MTKFLFEIKYRLTTESGTVTKRIIKEGFAATKAIRDYVDESSISDQDYYDCHPYFGEDLPE